MQEVFVVRLRRCLPKNVMLIMVAIWFVTTGVVTFLNAVKLTRQFASKLWMLQLMIGSLAGLMGADSFFPAYTYGNDNRNLSSGNSNIRSKYMKYPNASKGLQTMVKAEFITWATSFFAVIVYVLALPEIGIFDFENNITGASFIVIIAIIVLYIAAYVIASFGIIKAMKDEPAFKVSLYAITASIVLAILSLFFYENETLYLIISIAGDVAQFFLVHYIIHGIMHISEHLGKPDFSKKGKKIFTVIYIGLVFEVIVRIIEIIWGLEQGEELAMPFDVVAYILKTVEYVMFFLYIVRGNKMLKENDA